MKASLLFGSFVSLASAQFSLADPRQVVVPTTKNITTNTTVDGLKYSIPSSPYIKHNYTTSWGEVVDVFLHPSLRCRDSDIPDPTTAEAPESTISALSKRLSFYRTSQQIHTCGGSSFYSGFQYENNNAPYLSDCQIVADYWATNNGAYEASFVSDVSSTWWAYLVMTKTCAFAIQAGAGVLIGNGDICSLTRLSIEKFGNGKKYGGRNVGAHGHLYCDSLDQWKKRDLGEDGIEERDKGVGKGDHDVSVSWMVARSPLTDDEIVDCCYTDN